MTLSGKKLSAEAYGWSCSVSMTARPLFVALVFVTLLTIMVDPTLASRRAYQDNHAQEAQVSGATTHFGLSLMKALSPKTDSGKAKTRQATDNTVVSPLSLQILLNMILLGAEDQSLSQAELAKVLGYGIEASGASELSLEASEEEDADSTSARLGRPHEAMHSVVESIKKVTRSPVNDRDPRHKDDKTANKRVSSSDGSHEGHRRRQFQSPSRTRRRDTSLENDVSFTLANLMLTNKDLVQVNPEYENELKKYYEVKLEQFSRRRDSQNKNDTSGGEQQVKLHERVNNWVKNITKNQITDLVNERMLSNPLLLFVLVNAAHFKAGWLKPFDPESTQNHNFYNNGNSSAGVETKFMRQKGQFGYAEFNYKKEEQAPRSELSEGDKYAEYEAYLRDKERELDPVGQSASKIEPSTEKRRRLELTANMQFNHKKGRQEEDYAKQYAELRPESEKQQAPLIEPSDEERRRLELTANISCRALSLPFSLNRGHEMSMVVLLPSQRDGLDKLIENLNVDVLNEIYRSLSNEKVKVELPKFKIEASHDVKAMLKKLGLTRIFGGSAELDRMFAPTAKLPAKVDIIIHKAKITVNEQGVEAAAASAATGGMGSSPSKKIPPTFIADHPFLYIIRHNRSNMPLFMGQVRSF